MADINDEYDLGVFLLIGHPFLLYDSVTKLLFLIHLGAAPPLLFGQICDCLTHRREHFS